MSTNKPYLSKPKAQRLFQHVFWVFDGKLQSLLKYERPGFYNYGKYGWNWDGYVLDHNTLLICGIRNITGVAVDDTLVKEFETKAREIPHDATYEDKGERRTKLLEELLKRLHNQ